VTDEFKISQGPISRRSMIAGAFATPLAAMGERIPAVRPERSKPNVIFFLPDQVRRCELGCYGGGQNVPTPHIDHFASQGLRMAAAVSTFPLCSPYRAMLQTARMPQHSGGIMNWTNLPTTGQAMADVFNAAGYNTAYIGKWHLASGRMAGTLRRNDQPTNKSPEPEFVSPGPARMGYQYWAAYNFATDYNHAFYYRDTPHRLHMPKFETDSEVDMAIDYMKSHAHSEKPFFMVLSPHPPHPQWTDDNSPAADLAKTPRNFYMRPNVKGWKDTPTNDSRCYYAMMRNMDENFGRLMEYLDEAGLTDNTIVVFASDHGEMLASQSRYNKMVPYSESIDVPLIFRWPRHIAAGQTHDALFRPIDHLPTLASMCGATIPSILDGQDQSWALLGKPGKGLDDVLLMNFLSHWDFPETQTLWPEWRGVYNRQFTYARWIDGTEELYDNTADPYQFRNLYDGREAPEVMKHMRARLETLLRENHDEFLPGNKYISWFDIQRNVVRTALGPVKDQPVFRYPATV
jgi:arylsulfatase A-like enzyme